MELNYIIMNKIFGFLLISLNASLPAYSQEMMDEVRETLYDQVMAEAQWALEQEPVTVTATASERSAGGRHDFYSEGDYWWPDPENQEGPYIQRDGMTNPDNFTAHREAMIRFSRIIGSLASAYALNGDDKYVSNAFRHLHAWFIDTATFMNPSLLYAQAIKGRVTGRGIGIIDAIHLIEVAQGVRMMENADGADQGKIKAIKQWFSQFTDWLLTHPFGKDEMNTTNNHATCWAMQVATYARLTENDSVLAFWRDRYKNVLLPGQMAPDGSFPRELGRTKPYGYSLFNLDAMATVCQILSDENEDLWSYQTPDGKSIRKGIEYLFPYVKDKSAWTYPPDIMYWENWPVAHPFLVFGAWAFEQQEWLDVWKKLDHSPETGEVLQNLPVRNPLIW